MRIGCDSQVDAPRFLGTLPSKYYALPLLRLPLLRLPRLALWACSGHRERDWSPPPFTPARAARPRGAAPATATRDRFGGDCYCAWGCVRGLRARVSAASRALHPRFRVKEQGIASRSARSSRDRMGENRDGSGSLGLSTAPVCRRCRSRHTRRSRPHNMPERVLSALTPLRFHVCEVCGTRGYHLGHRSRRLDEKGTQPRTVGPSRRQRRATRLRRRERLRVVRSLLIALALGCAAAVLVHRCGNATPVGEGQ